MSTKIYSGYKLNIPPAHLLQFCHYIRDKLQPIVRDDIAPLYLTDELLDVIFKLFSLENSPTMLTKRVATQLEWCMWLYPRDNDVLCIFSGPNKYEKVFKKLDKVQFWGYWNNTDPDESCSDEEWLQREQDWQIIDYGYLCEFSLEFKPFSKYWYNDITILWDYDVPNIDKFREYAMKQVLQSLDITCSKTEIKRLRFLIPGNLKKYIFRDLKIHTKQSLIHLIHKRLHTSCKE